MGTNGASETYVASKIRSCAEIGFQSSLIRMEDSVSEDALLEEICQLNKDVAVDGILVQLPLPKKINEEKIINAIDPQKDVDGFHPFNIGRLVQRYQLLFRQHRTVSCFCFNIIKSPQEASTR